MATQQLPVAKLLGEGQLVISKFFFQGKMFVRNFLTATHMFIGWLFRLLTYLQDKKYDIGIYSAGNYDFQYRRIELSGVLQYMNDKLIFIHKEKDTKKFISTLPNSYVVDDNIKIINNIANYKHINPILINRNGEEMELEKNVIEIKTLLDLKNTV